MPNLRTDVRTDGLRCLTRHYSVMDILAVKTESTMSNLNTSVELIEHDYNVICVTWSYSMQCQISHSLSANKKRYIVFSFYLLLQWYTEAEMLISLTSTEQFLESISYLKRNKLCGGDSDTPLPTHSLFRLQIWNKAFAELSYQTFISANLWFFSTIVPLLPH